MPDLLHIKKHAPMHNQSQFKCPTVDQEKQTKLRW